MLYFIHKCLKYLESYYYLHFATNKHCNLRYVPTFFGAEMEVSCFLYKEHNKESPAGYWELAIEKQKSLIKKLDDKDINKINEENVAQTKPETNDQEANNDEIYNEERMYRCGT